MSFKFAIRSVLVSEVVNVCICVRYVWWKGELFVFEAAEMKMWSAVLLL